MRLVIKGRQQGKTMQLIYASELTGIPIVQPTNRMCNYTKEMAKEMGCIIPEPISVSELREYGLKRSLLTHDTVLLDNVGLVIGEALNEYLGVSVIGGTMTDGLKDQKIQKGYTIE